MMAEVEKTEKTQSAEKLPKPAEKYIWFGVSVIIAAVGFFLRTSDIQLNFWVKETVHTQINSLLCIYCCCCFLYFSFSLGIKRYFNLIL